MSEEILNQVGTIMRVYVPAEFRRRFEEHLPLRPGDKILASSQEMGDEYQFVIYVHNYVPRKAQIAYTLKFAARVYKICGKEVRFMYNMFDREEPVLLPAVYANSTYGVVSS
jgi:hypothetical protein